MAVGRSFAFVLKFSSLTSDGLDGVTDKGNDMADLLNVNQNLSSQASTKGQTISRKQIMVFSILPKKNETHYPE